MNTSPPPMVSVCPGPPTTRSPSSRQNEPLPFWMESPFAGQGSVEFQRTLQMVEPIRIEPVPTRRNVPGPVFITAPCVGVVTSPAIVRSPSVRIVAVRFVMPGEKATSADMTPPLPV